MEHCYEDVILVRDNAGTWACGPAYDDVVLVHGNTCDVLVGGGAFDNGTWDTYTCATIVPQHVPNTALVHSAHDGTMLLAGFLLLATAVRMIVRK